MIAGFISDMRGQGYAVESVCRVLRQQGCQIAARTYREWTRPNKPIAARTVSDAVVQNAVREIAWNVDDHGQRRMTPEGLYGRRKMTAIVQRSVPDASPGSVDRAMKSLGLQGVTRAKGVRTTIPSKDGKRAGDLLDRDFTAAAPNSTWVTDFTYVRTWAGFTYVAFIVDVFAQKIVAWHASTSTHGVHQRALQNRVHPHNDLPRRPVQDDQRRRVRHRGLGGLVQQPQASQ